MDNYITNTAEKNYGNLHLINFLNMNTSIREANWHFLPQGVMLILETIGWQIKAQH